MNAADLGKRLLSEVEEAGFDEVLSTFRVQDEAQKPHLSLPQLDTLIHCVLDARQPNPIVSCSAPIIEITSRLPGSGKTQLLYHLIAVAVLPRHLGGKQASVVFIDTDNHFSTCRLAQQLRRTIVTYTREYFIDEESMDETIAGSLKHVHVLRPQSLAGTISTLDSLQDYLFDATRHHSFDRAIAFVALDSATAFYWQARSDAENAALKKSLDNADVPTQPHDYVQLAAAFKHAARVLATPLIYTTGDFNPPRATNSDPASLRPSLPPPWLTLSTLRLTLQRAPIRRLPVEIILEDALRECEMRQKVVMQGKFECLVNDWGIEDKIIQLLRVKGAMFDFCVTAEGVKIGDGPE